MNTIIESQKVYPDFEMAKEIGSLMAKIRHTRKSLEKIIPQVKDPFVRGQLQMLLTQLNY